MNIWHTWAVTESEFWLELANHILESGDISGFVTSSFIYSVSNHTESIAALSILNLPDASPNHAYKSIGGKGIEITTKDNTILFKKEIKEAEADLDTNILVIHRFFEANNQDSNKKITEFIVNQVYGCETIITNVSTKAQEFQILWQIPEGSLPLQNTNYQKSENKKLNSYSTTTFRYFFYFPEAGQFVQFPANITIGEKVVAVANECKFNVVSERTQISDETFKDILLSGDKQAVIDFLATANILNEEKGFSFYYIYWMLKDKEYFKQVTDTLRERKIYEPSVWAYGFYHKDIDTIKEHIMKSSHIITQTGTFFKSSLIECSPEESNFRHYDYFPIINARAHKLGDNSNPGIMNKQFRNTYHIFLRTLAEKEELDNVDLLNLTYYYLLQDRINEAIDIFKKVDEEYFKTHSTLKMQFDYMRAYLDFFVGTESGFKIAKDVSKEYADYPILSWQILFKEIVDQLEEYSEGVDYDEDIDQEDETKRKANLKKSINLEPLLHCELDNTNKQIKVEYNNIPSILIKYYVIDPEVMFSRAPFLNQNTEDFAYVKPMDTQTVELDKKLKSSVVDIKDDLQAKNLVIEITGEGKQQFLTYFSTSLKVAINENFGELKVTDNDDKPLSMVYVKTFSKDKSNSIKFFKDGYTDIRGKFEYAQINSKKLLSIEKFAMLIMSDDYGSVTREAKVPSNLEIQEEEQDVGFLATSHANKYRQQKIRSHNRKTKNVA